MKVLFKKARALGLIPKSEIGVLALWCIGLLLIEMLGSRATGDLHDMVAILFLLAGLSVTLAFHGTHPLRVVAAILRGTQRALSSVLGSLTEFGFDLVERPAFRAAPPFALTVVCGAGLSVNVLLISFASSFPGGLRFLAENVSYLLHLGFVFVLWSGILVGLLMTLLFPVMVIRDVFVLRRIRNGVVPEFLGYAVGCAYMSFMGFIALLAPLQAATFVLAVTLGLTVLPMLVLRRPRLSLLFRLRKGGIRRVDWLHFSALQTLCVFLPLIALILLSRGASILNGTGPMISASMPVTSAFGLALVWSSAGSSIVWCALSSKLLLLGTRNDPAAASPMAVYVEGAESSELRQATRLACNSAHADLANDRRKHFDDAVRVKLVPSIGDADLQWRGGVPCVTLSQLNDTSVMRRLHRRDDIQRRRKLVTGIEALFKHAHARKYEFGEGFWLAPHLWFVLGLSRDSAGPAGVEADGSWVEILGRPYHHVFSTPVRHHCHQIFKGLGVDLIFIADGVRFSAIRRVLRIFFEQYDMHGGNRRLEERDLVGIPGVRCILHELDLDTPFTDRKYPEPDYEDVARARILHIYRDRGGDKIDAEIPDLFDVAPVGAPSIPSGVSASM